MTLTTIGIFSRRRFEELLVAHVRTYQCHLRQYRLRPLARFESLAEISTKASSIVLHGERVRPQGGSTGLANNEKDILSIHHLRSSRFVCLLLHYVNRNY